jgi:hypothetical protein
MISVNSPEKPQRLRYILALLKPPFFQGTKMDNIFKSLFLRLILSLSSPKMEFGKSIKPVPKSGQIGTIVLIIWYERLFYGM